MSRRSKASAGRGRAAGPIALRDFGACNPQRKDSIHFNDLEFLN